MRDPTHRPSAEQAKPGDAPVPWASTMPERRPCSYTGSAPDGGRPGGQCCATTTRPGKNKKKQLLKGGDPHGDVARGISLLPRSANRGQRHILIIGYPSSGCSAASGWGKTYRKRVHTAVRRAPKNKYRQVKEEHGRSLKLHRKIIIRELGCPHWPSGRVLRQKGEVGPL